MKLDYSSQYFCLEANCYAQTFTSTVTCIYTYTRTHSFITHTLLYSRCKSSLLDSPNLVSTCAADAGNLLHFFVCKSLQSFNNSLQSLPRAEIMQGRGDKSPEISHWFTSLQKGCLSK